MDNHDAGLKVTDFVMREQVYGAYDLKVIRKRTSSGFGSIVIKRKDAVALTLTTDDDHYFEDVVRELIAMLQEALDDPCDLPGGKP